MYDKLITEAQAAERLGMKPSTLRRWRWEGRGPGFIKIGHRVRYRESEVESFIEAGRRTSTSDFGSAT
jgi:excisionase family DNA binding protein